MSRQKKPWAYLDKYITGYFGLERTTAWIARDYWDNEVARGRTRRECEQRCRERGYAPQR